MEAAQTVSGLGLGSVGAAWAGRWNLGFRDQNWREVGGWQGRDRQRGAGILCNCSWECSQWISGPPWRPATTVGCVWGTAGPRLQRSSVCTVAEGRTLPARAPGVGHRPEAPSLTPGVVMGPPLPPAQTIGTAARCLCSHHMVWGLLSCLPPLRTPEQGTSCRICTPLTEGQTTSKCQGKGDWHPY